MCFFDASATDAPTAKPSCPKRSGVSGYEPASGVAPTSRHESRVSEPAQQVGSRQLHSSTPSWFPQSSPQPVRRQPEPDEQPLRPNLLAIALRAPPNFHSQINVICPVQPRLKKYSASPLPQITPTNPAIPSRLEGRWPSSRTLGRVAVDAAASGAWWCWQGGPEVRERTQRADDWRGCVRQSRVVLAPVAGVKPAEERRPNRVLAILQSAGDGGKTNSSPGRARHKPSNHCAGKAGCPADTCMLVCALACAHCTRDRGCQPAPGLPCAL